jgi:hypothetical protein
VHYAHVVQELYGLSVLMMVESFFVLLCKSLDFARHNVQFQVSVEVIVSNIPGCIDNVPEYFVLESLYNVYYFVWCNPRVRYRMSKRVLVFVCIEVVCYEGTVRSPFLSANAFLCMNVHNEFYCDGLYRCVLTATHCVLQ